MGILHPGKREIKSEMQRKKILDAAVTLFEQYGLNAVSVRDITETAEVSTGTFYHYFKNKQELINTVYTKIQPTFVQPLAEVGVNPSPRSALYDFLTASLVAQVLHDGLEFTTYRVFVRRRHSPKKGEMYQGCLKLVRQAQAKGELTADTDAEKLPDYLLTVQRAVVLEWCLAEGGFDLLEAMKPAIACAFRAFDQ